MQEAQTKSKKNIIIDTEWCKGCGICAAFCPKQALEMNQKNKAVWARPADCIRCGLCELRCPDSAIQILEEEE